MDVLGLIAATVLDGAARGAENGRKEGSERMSGVRAADGVFSTEKPGDAFRGGVDQQLLGKHWLGLAFLIGILLTGFFTVGYTLGRAEKAATPCPAASIGLPEGGSASSKQAAPQLYSAHAGMPPPPLSSGAAPPTTQPVAAVATGGRIYLQAAALKQSEAELTAGVLKEKAFAVVIAPGPTDDMRRVLVGPFSDPASLARSRADLEAAGFKPFTRRY